jgi:hypothetical protein
LHVENKMSLLDRVFASRQKTKAPLPATRPSAGIGVTPVRRELVQMAHRDTLRRHGVPEDWLGMEVLSSSGVGRAPSVHARLLVKRWHPELMVYLPQLTKVIQNRLLKYDRTSASWLSGLSLRYDFPADQHLDDLPSSPTWVPEPRQDSPDEDMGAHLVATAASARDWLNRLLSSSDASMRERHQDFSPTQPMISRGDGSGASGRLRS